MTFNADLTYTTMARADGTITVADQAASLPEPLLQAASRGLLPPAHAVRVDGDWEGWLDFFLDGVATIADEAVASARELFALVAADRARMLGHEGMSVVALRLFELLPRHPVVTVASVMKFVETTKPTAGRAIELLVAAGVLVETTGKKRDRSFVYQGYLDRLRVGTDLDAAPRTRT